MTKIVDLMVGATGKMLAEQKVGLQATPAAKQLLAQIGFDPAYGARPLRRAIQDRVENPIASYIISGSLKPGDTAVVDIDANKNFVFRRIASSAPQPPTSSPSRTALRAGGQPPTNNPAPFTPPKKDDDQPEPPPIANNQTMSANQ